MNMVWEVSNRCKTSAGLVAFGKSGDGPDLVLAHGWPWSSFAWHRLIPIFSRHFTVHWFDMPGYGRSEMNDQQATSLDVQGAVFAEMLEYWALEKPAVVAHDFGGAVSLRTHLLHEVDYSKLVLMNVVALSPWGSAFFDHVGRHIDAFSGLPPHIHRAIVRAYIEGALVNDLADDDLKSLVAPWLSDDGQKSFYNQFAQADDKYTDEIYGLLGAMRCPVSILWGEDDPWIPIDRGRTLADNMPGSNFAPIAGAGHLPQLELPEIVAQLILKELANGLEG